MVETAVNAALTTMVSGKQCVDISSIQSCVGYNQRSRSSTNVTFHEKFKLGKTFEIKVEKKKKRVGFITKKIVINGLKRLD